MRHPRYEKAFAGSEGQHGPSMFRRAPMAGPTNRGAQHYKQAQVELGIRDVLVSLTWCRGADGVRRRTHDHKLFVCISTRLNLSEARLLHDTVPHRSRDPPAETIGGWSLGPCGPNVVGFMQVIGSLGSCVDQLVCNGHARCSPLLASGVSNAILSSFVNLVSRSRA